MAMTRHNRSAAFRGASPWSLGDRVGLLLWQFAWPLLCGWTPKPFNPWRLWVLRRFGASVVGRPFVHSRARIQVPWNITLHDRSCVGDRANLYSLDRITLGEGALAAQESYLCTGTHDLADPVWPLLTAPIVLERDAFVGARAFVMPGVTIGERAVIGACSVVTKDMPSWTVCAGNPCAPTKPQAFAGASGVRPITHKRTDDRPDDRASGVVGPK